MNIPSSNEVFKLRTTFGDKVLFLLFLILSSSSYFIFHALYKEGNTVYIKKNDEILYILSLEEERVITLESGEDKNVIEIKNNRVRMAEATCPRQLCIKQGWIKKGAIICLPNRIMITVGHEDEGQKNVPYDAVTK